MNVLVTGGTGFLGAHLVPTLQAAGMNVTAIGSQDLDLQEQRALNRFPPAHFHRIYHLAAWTRAGDFCLKHPGEQWIINQQINTNVLTWWQSQQPQAKLIAIGSSCCYEPGLPHTEENFLRGLPIDSLFSYAMTKRMLYAGLVSLNLQYGLKYLFVVPSTLYGAGYHLDGRQMHFIFDLMRKILVGKRQGTPVTLWGDGYQRRELVHVTDFVRAMSLLADTYDNEIVNIGSGVEHSIRRFAELLCSLVGYPDDRIHYDTAKYVGAKSKMLDIGKLKMLLPDFRQTELELGLKETIEWYSSKFA